MKSTKFNEIYEQNKHIITEKNHGWLKVGPWTKNAAGKSVGKMLKNMVVKDVIHSFNDEFVKKKWFNFKKVFKSKPVVEVLSYGAANCKIRLTYNYELDEKETELFIYGPKEKGKYLPLLPKPKPGGIFFNDNFKELLEACEYEDPGKSEDMDLNGIKKLNLSIVFSFNKITYIDQVKKQSQKINPNYIKSLKGNIYMLFDSKEETETLIGTCEYFQSRYKNMDPPKPLKDQIKDMWNKPNKDFGLLGTLAAKGLGAIGGFATGSLFREKTQDESVILSIDGKFSFSNNIKGGDIDTRNANKKSEIPDVFSDYFESLADELNDSLSIMINVENKSEIEYIVTFIGRIDGKDVALMKIILKVR